MELNFVYCKYLFYLYKYEILFYLLFIIIYNHLLLIDLNQLRCTVGCVFRIIPHLINTDPMKLPYSRFARKCGSSKHHMGTRSLHARSSAPPDKIRIPDAHKREYVTTLIQLAINRDSNAHSRVVFLHTTQVPDHEQNCR